MKTVFLIFLLLSINVNALPFFNPSTHYSHTAAKTSASMLSGIMTGGATSLLLPVTAHYASLRDQKAILYGVLSGVLLVANFRMNQHYVGEGYDSFSTWIASGTMAIVSFIMMIREG